MQTKTLYVELSRGGSAALAELLRREGYTVAVEAGAKTKRRAATRVDAESSGLTVGRASANDRGGRLGRSTSRRRLGRTNLRALRESVGKTQGEVARRTAMSQPQLSRLEARKDHLISTLRKYVRALGGNIEIVALIGDARIVLRDV